MTQQNATKKAFEVIEGHHTASLNSPSSEIREVEKDYDYSDDADVSLSCSSYQPYNKETGSHYKLVVRVKDNPLLMSTRQKKNYVAVVSLSVAQIKEMAKQVEIWENPDTL